MVEQVASEKIIESRIIRSLIEGGILINSFFDYLDTYNPIRVFDRSLSRTNDRLLGYSRDQQLPTRY